MRDVPVLSCECSMVGIGVRAGAAQCSIRPALLAIPRLPEYSEEQQTIATNVSRWRAAHQGPSDANHVLIANLQPEACQSCVGNCSRGFAIGLVSVTVPDSRGLRYAEDVGYESGGLIERKLGMSELGSLELARFAS